MIVKELGSEMKVSFRAFEIMSQNHKDFIKREVFQAAMMEVYENFENMTLRMTCRDSGWVRRNGEYVRQIHVTAEGTEKERRDEDEW